MKRYINVRVGGTVETIDEVDSKDFSTIHEFKTRLAQVIGSHRMIVRQGEVYASQRKTAAW
jgi:hypothetical protein